MCKRPFPFPHQIYSALCCDCKRKFMPKGANRQLFVDIQRNLFLDIGEKRQDCSGIAAASGEGGVEIRI